MNQQNITFEGFISGFNPVQKQAVLHSEGPLLIIAGAGSGKTTVLCGRIANLLSSGVCPWQVLAVTFTNKAAMELKERLNKMGANANDVWALTFHSCCVKMLRRGIERLGYKNSFAIYDTDDSARVIKQCMVDLGITDKAFSQKMIQNIISRAKDKLISPEKFEDNDEYAAKMVKSVYKEYQKRLKQQNALDFDDIIFKTVEMLRENPDILDKWQTQFKYIMVDEYQDTNMAQFELISLLAGKYGNLCVVGDEDQSIYRFRGATIENILSFERQFSAKVIKLEQNYRSTEMILKAANAVISKNTQRKEKELWTDLGKGSKIKVVTLSDEQSEAMFVANSIMDGRENGERFSDNTILYRTNAQSRNFELALSRMGIPYVIIGGTKFYDRKEIKDILAYLSIIDNPFDMVRLRRIINVPKRSIGESTQNEIERLSLESGLSPIDIIEKSEYYPSLLKKSKPLSQFSVFYKKVSINSGGELNALIDDIIDQSGYREMLMAEGDEGQSRLQNIEELKSSAVSFLEENEESGLSEFLGQIALISDIDSYDPEGDHVSLMTIHSAKGTEFENVYLAGAEENIFPSFRSLSEPLGLEEERRLAYVAITRAKKNLCITHTKQRLLFGATQRNNLSRFVADIPKECLELTDKTISSKEYAVSEIGRNKLRAEFQEGYLQSQYQKRAVMPEFTIKTNDFSAGDRVNHRVFGDGIVLGTTPMGDDSLLEIAFDRIGTKKIAANFAKIKKI
ncbi:MAG: UvrD-helicase domain-containing protein [Eubacterium sp.]|jgi:DNA helicase-2/ATP-dependent DNA helicase PcrA|nr:UvrD-helicase domain-containing protein [Eubacterium sp.]